MTLVRRSSSLRAILFALALGAILLRGLIAPGWMPVADASGIRVALCNAQDPAEMAAAQALLDDRLGQHHAPVKPHPEQPCAFAALGLAFDAPVVVAIFAPLFVRDAPALPTAPTTAPGRGLAAPPPPATGPPALF